MPTTAGQAWVFLAMVYGGLVMGVLYDLLFLLRRLLHAGPFWTGALDLLFWLLAAVLCACALAYAGGGMRLYVLLGCACGALLYAVAIGQWVRRLTDWLAEKKRARKGRSSRKNQTLGE